MNTEQIEEIQKEKQEPEAAARPQNVTFQWLPDEPKFEPVIPTELKAAAQASRAAREKLDLIDRLITDAETEVAEFDAQLKRARKNLADHQAGAAIDGSAADEQVRAEFIAVRDAADVAAAKLEGLKSRRLQAERDTLVAEELHLHAWHAFSHSAAEEWIRKVYLPAAEHFAKVVRESFSVAAGLARNASGDIVLQSLVTTTIPNPADRSQPVHQGGIAGHSIWSGDSAAQELYQSLVTLRREFAPKSLGSTFSHQIPEREAN